MYIQSYVTFQGNIEIGWHKTGGRYIQILLIWNALWRKLRLCSHNTSYCLIEVVTKAGLTVVLMVYWVYNSVFNNILFTGILWQSFVLVKGNLEWQEKTTDLLKITDKFQEKTTDLLKAMTNSRKKPLTCWKSLTNSRKKPLTCWKSLTNSRKKPLTCWKSLTNSRRNPLTYWKSLTNSRRKPLTYWKSMTNSSKKPLTY
jgi:hypothetical protein